MAKIEFSQGFMSGLPARLLKVGYSYLSYNDLANLGFFTYAGGGSIQGGVNFGIFKGVKPTIGFIKTGTNISTLFTNDRLLSFDTSGGDAGDLSPTTITNPIKITSIYKAAVMSGQATWFCMTRVANNTAAGHVIVGDVGLIGSGADLEMPDTDIVLGELYRVDNFNIHLPSFWEY